MIKYKKENSFLMFLSMCIVILLVICSMSFNFSLRGTRAYFGEGTTGTLGGTIYKVIYSSNWPNADVEDEIIEDQKKNIYMVMDNMFDAPDGYEFIGWTDSDGKQYLSSDVIKLTANLELYAVWNLIDVGIRYGDVNQNGEIDKEDYLLVEDYVYGRSNLNDNALVNADVNNDEKVDLVDADIIKQVCLGNTLYMGKLPVEPILVYEIYEGKIDVGNNGNVGGDSNILEDKENESLGDDGYSGGGSGQIGIGSGSSGNTSANSGNTSSGGINGNSSSDNSSSSELDNDDNEDIVEEKKYYYGIFMNGNLEYMTTRCEVVKNSADCDLILPNNPVKDEYVFSGWSLDKNCSDGNIIKKSIKVNSDNTYYACFILKDRENNNNIYLIVMIIGICLIAGRMIWYLFKRYREDNMIDNN